MPSALGDSRAPTTGWAQEGALFSWFAPPPPCGLRPLASKSLLPVHFISRVYAVFLDHSNMIHFLYVAQAGSSVDLGQIFVPDVVPLPGAAGHSTFFTPEEAKAVPH